MRVQFWGDIEMPGILKDFFEFPFRFNVGDAVDGEIFGEPEHESAMYNVTAIVFHKDEQGIYQRVVIHKS